MVEDEAATTSFADALLRMSGVLLTRESVNTVVEHVTTLAVATLPGSTGAGVSIVNEAGKRTTAASDPLVEQADRHQYELDEGPCLSAARERAVIRIDDLLSERRWPRWREAVAELGLRSVLSAPMIVGDESIGAIKVYSREVAAYDEHSEHLLTLVRRAGCHSAGEYAVAAGRAATQRTAEGLVDAPRRDRSAKGILIAQGAAGEEAAFGMLVSASQRSNVKLHELAAQIVASVISRRTESPHR
jgi:GAF domain-containing protein